MGRKEINASPDPGRVRAMFGAIADRYDLMNTVMTGGRHYQWRRLAVARAAPPVAGRVLDVCCGTGDFAFALYDAVGPLGQVTGIDFSRRMLAVARTKAQQQGKPVEFVHGDATRIGFKDDEFDSATVGFGIRNVDDIQAAFREMARVVRPGGKVVCLEITQPSRQPFAKFFALWFDRLVPALGSWVSRNGAAYAYLPSSVRRFPPPGRLAKMMEEAGLKEVGYQLMAGSIIALHWGTA